MTLRIPDVGETRLLGNMVGKNTPENQLLKLFSNNITPADADVAGTYTEITGGGYAAKTLTATSWNAPTSGAPSFIDYAQQTWTFTASVGNVYGYYVVGETSGTLLWSERFSDGPYNVAASGDIIRVTPKITLQDTLD